MSKLKERQNDYGFIKAKNSELAELRRTYMKHHCQIGEAIEWKRGNNWVRGKVVEHSGFPFDRIKVRNEKTGTEYWVNIYETAEQE